jgi:hypothetical protein
MYDSDKNDVANALVELYNQIKGVTDKVAPSHRTDVNRIVLDRMTAGENAGRWVATTTIKVHLRSTPNDYEPKY